VTDPEEASLELLLATSEDGARYAASMHQIKLRVTEATRMLRTDTPSRIVLESAALQVRLALEALALSSLLPNRALVETVSTAYKKKGHDEVMRLLKRVHPDFWPRSARVVSRDGQHIVVPAEEGFLREEDYFRAWGSLSAWCHAENPYATPADILEGVRLVVQTINDVIALLNKHYRTMKDQPASFLCDMREGDLLPVVMVAPSSASGEVPLLFMNMAHITPDGEPR
jgi:hypothetical protein